MTRLCLALSSPNPVALCSTPMSSSLSPCPTVPPQRSQLGCGLVDTREALKSCHGTGPLL